MINGTVIFYNSERGFGYIKPEGEKEDGKKKDVRVLQKSLSRAGIKGLTERQKVKFDTHTDPDSGKLTVNNIEVE